MASNTNRHLASNDSPQRHTISSRLPSTTNERHSDSNVRREGVNPYAPRSTPQRISDTAKRGLLTRRGALYDDGDDTDSDDSSDSSQSDQRRRYTDGAGQHRPDLSSRGSSGGYQVPQYGKAQLQSENGMGNYSLEAGQQYGLSSRHRASRHIAGNAGIDEQIDRSHPSGRDSQLARGFSSSSHPLLPMRNSTHGMGTINEQNSDEEGTVGQRQALKYSDYLPSRDRHTPTAGNPRGTTAKRGSNARDNKFSTSPPSAYLMGNRMDGMMADTTGRNATSASESGSHGNSATQKQRRGSSNSLSDLVNNRFDFTALVNSTKLKATVDTGSDENMVSKKALTKAGIDNKLLEDVDKTLDLEGLGGTTCNVNKRIGLTWGKVKDNGQKTQHGKFYVVSELPDNLEMVLNHSYLGAMIKRHLK